MGKQFDFVFPLFLFAFFVLSHAEGVLQILKKFVLGVWGIPQQAWKGISLSPACSRCRIIFVYRFLVIPIISNLFYWFEKQSKRF